MQPLSVFCFLIRSCQMKHNPLTVYTNVGLLKITIWQIYTLQIWQISLLASTHWNPQQMIGSVDSNMTWNAGREQHSSELFKRCSVCPRVGVHHTYILQPGDCNTVKTDKHQKGLQWWIQVLGLRHSINNMVAAFKERSKRLLWSDGIHTLQLITDLHAHVYQPESMSSKVRVTNRLQAQF